MSPTYTDRDGIDHKISCMHCVYNDKDRGPVNYCEALGEKLKDGTTFKQNYHSSSNSCSSYRPK
jgi:hypothetical protein